MSADHDWIVATGFARATGEIIHTTVHPLTVEFVHAFPHRVEVLTTENRRIVAVGCIDDSGAFLPIEQHGCADDGTPVLVVVDVLGVDADALA